MPVRGTWRPSRRGRARGAPRAVAPTADDPEPLPPPSPLPVQDRDPGFRHLFELYALRDWARETMCHRPGPAERSQLRRLDHAIARLETEPLVADRAFEAVTHCPAGHIGAHLTTGVLDEHVERVCCFPACRISWLERS